MILLNSQPHQQEGIRWMRKHIQIPQEISASCLSTWGVVKKGRTMSAGSAPLLRYPEPHRPEYLVAPGRIRMHLRYVTWKNPFLVLSPGAQKPSYTLPQLSRQMRPQRDLSLGRTWASRFSSLTTLWIVGNICGLFCEFLPVSFFLRAGSGEVDRVRQGGLT